MVYFSNQRIIFENKFILSLCLDSIKKFVIFGSWLFVALLRLKHVCWLRRFSEVVSEQRAATKENVQRKQARTEGEREDSDVEGSGSDSDDDDEDAVPYNPKNLPLGWDGKVKIEI